jgi:hypothetical protein
VVAQPASSSAKIVIDGLVARPEGGCQHPHFLFFSLRHPGHDLLYQQIGLREVAFAGLGRGTGSRCQHEDKADDRAHLAAPG